MRERGGIGVIPIPPFIYAGCGIGGSEMRNGCLWNLKEGTKSMHNYLN